MTSHIEPKDALGVLLELTRVLIEETALERALQAVTDAAMELFPGCHCSVRMFDEKRVQLLSGARSGTGEDHHPITFHRGEGVVGWVADNNEVARDLRGETDSALDTRGGGALTELHIENFLDSVRGLAEPNAPVDDGQRSVLLCHLGNIAQRTGRALRCDPTNGRILDDDEAMDYWGRDYEPGWEPTV